METHSCSFLRGKNWYTYKYLENRMLETSRFVTLAPENVSTWSENLADLLNLIGSAIDTFFRNMHRCPTVSVRKEISDVQLRVSKRKNKKWNIYDFMDAYEPLYELSKNEVMVPFGLSSLGVRKPFENFGVRKEPSWWTAYNHIKHEYYDKITEANLGNVIDALGALLILNALHKDSQEYLVKNGILKCDSLNPNYVVNILRKSFIGYPKTMGLGCLIETPIFIFTLRKDIST